MRKITADQQQSNNNFRKIQLVQESRLTNDLTKIN